MGYAEAYFAPAPKSARSIGDGHSSHHESQSRDIGSHWGK